MQGTILFELYNPETQEVVASAEVTNKVMDSVINMLAGHDNAMAGLNGFQLVLGTGYDGTEPTTMTRLMNEIYRSAPVNAVYNGITAFSVEISNIRPDQANGNLIEIGLMKGGKLYNRAILKRSGILVAGSHYEYLVVGGFVGTINHSVVSDIVEAQATQNGSTIKLTWNPDLTSRTNTYDVYRRVFGTSIFHLLGTTRRSFFYDDGYMDEQLTRQPPSPQGTIPKPVILAAVATTDPVPYSQEKNTDFAARAKVNIEYLPTP